ncbi:8-amino-7-oxononanoate synthase [Rosistilla carotiformis]|uniref:8-amino-7-oxononanoate synthase n=1 Tax=Rosistilla carotiformis TaxID=2528017 RepID=A0A518K1I4_9BACT|nr:8-amino-7-oxononanoate synthase [Rosistilla carotiformis]QDV71673.1 8-amino-7-oxononanoate synthase [Rosistilla carotiformis]
MDARFDWIAKQLKQLDGEGATRQLMPRQSQPGRMVIQSDGIDLVNFGSNDYLGMAAEQSTQRPEHGSMGSGASALVTGFSPVALQLQQRLAEWEATDSCVLFPTGFAANLGTISALAEAGDLILSDAANHASIIDGCRLSKAQRFVYPHNDTSAVAALLETHRRRFARVFIVTDSVFSMDGDFAPLETLCDLADRYDSILIADEAHGTGVFGDSGSGLCEHLGVKHRVPIRIGTLSKAIGAMGGFVVGPQVVTDYLVNRSRSMIFSTALPPALVSAALANVIQIQEEPQRRAQLFELSQRLRDRVASKWRLPPMSTPGQIVPFVVGSNEEAVRASQRLADAGLFVPAIRPPTVPKGTARLRVSLSSSHSDEEIDRLAEALCGLR